MAVARRYPFLHHSKRELRLLPGLMARGTQPCPLQIGQDQHHDRDDQQLTETNIEHGMPP